MRILILSLSDKRHMPMIAPYISYLEDRNIEYDIIRSNRYEQRAFEQVISTNNGNIYELNMVFEPSMNKLKKIIPFLKFRNKSIRIIRERKYDFIIIWNENTAAVFSTFLIRNYSGKYCINIRDIYTHQRGVRELVDLVIRYSSFATVPSPEMNTNNQSKTICVYNKDYSLLKMISPKSSFIQDIHRPIRITHMGFYYKVEQGAKDIVNALGNDDRFVLLFYGQGFDTSFKKYIDEKGFGNVYVSGAFPYEETATILNDTDIINSFYNRFEHPSLKVSFGIKHSYTPMLYIPCIADEDTCWGRLSRPYNLSYLVNQSNLKTLGDDLYEWYMGLAFEDFKKNCETFNKIVDDSIIELNMRLDDSLKEVNQ